LCMPAAAGGVPMCLQGVSLQELVQQLLPMLPALQGHLVTALSVIRQPPEPGREVLLEGKGCCYEECCASSAALKAVGDPVPVLSWRPQPSQG
jgi:hypothetical protein